METKSGSPRNGQTGLTRSGFPRSPHTAPQQKATRQATSGVPGSPSPRPLSGTHLSRTPQTPQGRGWLVAPLHPRDRHRGGLGLREVSGFEEALDKSPRSLASRVPPRDGPPRRRRPSEGGAFTHHRPEYAAALAGKEAGKEPGLEWSFGDWCGGCSPLCQGPGAKWGQASQEVQASWR